MWRWRLARRGIEKRTRKIVGREAGGIKKKVEEEGREKGEKVWQARCSLLAGETGVYFRKGFGGGSRKVEASVGGFGGKEVTAEPLWSSCGPPSCGRGFSLWALIVSLAGSGRQRPERAPPPDRWRCRYVPTSYVHLCTAPVTEEPSTLLPARG